MNDNYIDDRNTSASSWAVVGMAAVHHNRILAEGLGMALQDSLVGKLEISLVECSFAQADTRQQAANPDSAILQIAD